jgi:hypothetical protein
MCHLYMCFHSINELNHSVRKLHVGPVSMSSNMAEAISLIFSCSLNARGIISANQELELRAVGLQKVGVSYSL